MIHTTMERRPIKAKKKMVPRNFLLNGHRTRAKGGTVIDDQVNLERGDIPATRSVLLLHCTDTMYSHVTDDDGYCIILYCILLCRIELLHVLEFLKSRGRARNFWGQPDQ